MSEQGGGEQFELPSLHSDFDPLALPSEISPKKAELIPDYEQDVAEFRSATETINRIMPVEERVPGENTIFCTNMQTLPFDTTPLFVGALRQLGYDIKITKPTLDRKGRELSHDRLAVYAGSEDYTSVCALLISVRPFSDPCHRILYDIAKSKLRTRIFVPGAWQEEANQAYDIFGGVQGELVQRAYMTGLLVHDLRWKGPDGEKMRPALELRQTERDTYSTLRSQGLYPLGYEELFGLAASNIAHLRRDNPTILPPHAKRSPDDRF